VVEREASDVPARDVVRMIRDNRPLLLLCGSALLFLTGMFAMSTVAVFYARDVLGDASLYVAMTVVQTGAMVAAAALVPGLAGVIGRKRLYILAGGLAAIGAVGFAMAPASIPAIAIACYGIVGLGFGVINTLIFAFQADTVDYGEWRSGIRAEGGSYAVLSFTRKAGQAVGGAAAAYTIGFGGYVSGATTQSDAALAAIRGAAGIVPAVGVAAAAAMMLAYPLTEDRFRELIRELTARRGDNRGDQSTPPGATPAAAT
jgi:glucuronide carrier protein